MTSATGPARSQERADYKHEFDDGDHAALLERLRRIKGRAAVSGYQSDLYDQALADWRRIDDRQKGLTAGGLGAKRTESVYINYTAPQLILPF